MGSVVSCLKDTRRIEEHVVLLRLASRRFGLHHRKADSMLFNFSGPGGELVIAPEGFMAERLSSRHNYLLYEVNQNGKGYVLNMDNPLLPVAIEKPRRLSHPGEVDRFFAEINKKLNSIATIYWESIVHNNFRQDQLEEQCRKDQAETRQQIQQIKENIAEFRETLPYSGLNPREGKKDEHGTEFVYRPQTKRTQATVCRVQRIRNGMLSRQAG
jgi:DNA-binding protein H-NS